jgi:hypothetical protein
MKGFEPLTCCLRIPRMGVRTRPGTSGFGLRTGIPTTRRPSVSETVHTGGSMRGCQLLGISPGQLQRGYAALAALLCRSINSSKLDARPRQPIRPPKL